MQYNSTPLNPDEFFALCMCLEIAKVWELATENQVLNTVTYKRKLDTLMLVNDGGANKAVAIVGNDVPVKTGAAEVFAWASFDGFTFPLS